ncbi:hypothetical protein MTR67_044411 [Solanum verrucosum]|uniref:Uncharacterized protein n=1 Tax=Solanum verrucosum TaxID=315347 RepID=A0AAF0UTW2_SOLVR|nr:hypothetical protein MTR67_044411 [Solanum verrucosum]
MSIVDESLMKYNKLANCNFLAFLLSLIENKGKIAKTKPYAHCHFSFCLLCQINQYLGSLQSSVLYFLLTDLLSGKLVGEHAWQNLTNLSIGGVFC